ncbi:MAG: ABC transporter permease [Pseudanabaenaceae cyanobacterium bins.68]|nr:ABC transporter permease [Pseudanabaenaceae cyanobacterium bins.68]
MSKYWYETIAVGQRILLELLRHRRSLILWTIFPISILLLNGLILAEGNKIALKEAFRLTTPSTLVGAALFFSCLGGTISTIVSERESHTIKRLLLSPLSGISYYLGIFLAYGCVGLGQTILVYAVAAWFEVSFAGSWLWGLVVILLTIASYVGAGFMLGTKFAHRVEDVNGLVAGVGVPLLILGGAFFPTSFLSKELLLIAQFNPVYHMNEALSGFSAGNRAWNQPDMVIHLRFLFGFFLVAIAGGWLAYGQMLDQEKSL